MLVRSCGTVKLIQNKNQWKNSSFRYQFKQNHR